MRKLFTRFGVVAAAITAGVLIGGAAVAVVTGHTGGATVRQYYQHQTSPSNHSSPTFANVGNAVRIVTLSGPRLIDARFSAESQCDGPGGWCSLRIIATNAATGGVTVLDPASGTDFAFDTAGSTDNWESHAMERVSGILGAGTYRVRVQAAVVGGATNLRLDDWTLAVEVIRP